MPQAKMGPTVLGLLLVFTAVLFMTSSDTWLHQSCGSLTFIAPDVEIAELTEVKASDVVGLSSCPATSAWLSAHNQVTSVPHFAAGAAMLFGLTLPFFRRKRCRMQHRCNAQWIHRRAMPPDTSGPDFVSLRADFPALQQDVRPGVPLVYLDSAATSQKPKQVLTEMERFYSQDNSNVHRGMHTLSIRSTEAFEGARAKVAEFINAADPCEVIFTRNATEAINLVAYAWGRAHVHEGDEIILTVMEHHSNLVPWQILAEEVGAQLRFVGLTPAGTLDCERLESLISPRTKLVALCHVSNVLGCVNPVTWVAERAHSVGAFVLADACQSMPHMPVDVQTLGVDFLVASGHKMCGPTGIGFLWGRAEVLRASRPFLGGGEMIDEVQLEHSTYADIPHRLEAGTPAFAEAIALGAACDYLKSVGMDHVQAHEQHLTQHLWHRIREIPGVEVYGPAPEGVPHRAALVSFNLKGCHPNDLCTLADQELGVAMRAGHQCCQPLHKELGCPHGSSARISTYFYNTTEEIDVAITALKSASDLLSGDLSVLPELDVL